MRVASLGIMPFSVMRWMLPRDSLDQKVAPASKVPLRTAMTESSWAAGEAGAAEEGGGVVALLLEEVAREGVAGCGVGIGEGEGLAVEVVDRFVGCGGGDEGDAVVAVLAVFFADAGDGDDAVAHDFAGECVAGGAHLGKLEVPGVEGLDGAGIVGAAVDAHGDAEAGLHVAGEVVEAGDGVAVVLGVGDAEADLGDGGLPGRGGGWCLGAGGAGEGGEEG